MTTHAAMPLPRRAPARWSTGALVAVWLIVVVCGWWCIERFEFSVNESSSQRVVTKWPADSALVRPANRPTLLFFLHPKCPCTRASVDELSRLFTSLAETATPVPELFVIATIPPTEIEAWWNTDTIAQTQQIASANLFVDRGGREAARFGATTSGFVMLFDELGNRRYAGGITICRGHEGESAGRQLLAEMLRGGTTGKSEMPVFGCMLVLPEPNTRSELAEQSRHVRKNAKSSL